MEKAVTFKLISHSPDDTLRLGRILGELSPAGSFLALIGGLGAGKTLLTKGIALGLGVTDEGDVTSPSFVLVHEYRGRVPVNHVDLYRLERPGDVEGIGWDDLLAGGGVMIVEWAEKAEKFLPEDRIEVYLEWAGDEKRTICLLGRGRSSQQVIGDLENRWAREG